jgi:hypothetical protein
MADITRKTMIKTRGAVGAQVHELAAAYPNKTSIGARRRDMLSILGNELREIVWLALLVSGLSIAGVVLAAILVHP